jgi:hypothetical protein
MAITTLKHVVSRRVRTYLGDVRRHNHPLLGPSVLAGDPHEITQFFESQRVPTGDPHKLVHAPPISVWAMVLIPFVMTHLQ